MPKPYYKYDEQPWNAYTLGLWGWDTWIFQGTRVSVTKWGEAWTPGDPLTRPNRVYWSYIAKGVVVHSLPGAEVQTYSPTPLTGARPLSGGGGSMFDQGAVQLLTDRAYNKLVNDIYNGSNAALAVSLAEGRESLAMISERMSRLRSSYKALRRGDFRRFLNQLRVEPLKQHRSLKRTLGKEASGLWLEYWFGWAPLIQDAYDSYSVMTEDPTYMGAWHRNIGRAKTPVFVEEDRSDYGADYVQYTRFEGTLRVKMYLETRINNPNLALATKLGLTNPAVVAWELVPFSFVVDWFTGFGNAMSALTDLLGWDERNAMTTVYLSGTLTGTYGRSGQIVVKWPLYRSERQLTLYRPVPRNPVLKGFGNSLTRAATAASLMAQVLIAD